MQKSKITSLFLIDSFFSISLLFFSLFSIKKLTGYILNIQNLSPDLSSIQEQLATKNLTNYSPESLSSTLSTISSSLDKITLFQYLILPLTFFLIWLIFQAIIFYLLNPKFNLKTFIITTIPLYIIFLFIFSLSLNTILLLPSIISINLIIYLILYILFFYITLTIYSGSIQSLKNTKLFLYFIPYIFLTIIYLLILATAFIYFITDTTPYILILPFIIITIINIFYKSYFFKVVNL